MSHLDSKPRFNKHVKTNNNVKAFSRVARYLKPKRASLLLHSFTLANFKYCSLIWMLCGNMTNDKVNSVNKHALKMKLYDYN